MSDSVFYRKYRPKSFSDIIGQDIAKKILVNSLSSNSFSHAYLFTGPRGTGKTSTARIFAKALNCINFTNTNDVCNQCENCNIYNQNQAIDIIEMDAASNRGIDDIRNLKESVQFMPSIYKKKVYIIDEAHMLSREAFNALLKTLEEPPEHVVFILATTDAAKLPLTVLSRLLRIDFNLANNDSLTEKLKKILETEKIEFEDSAIEIVVKYAKGSFRDAESILTKLAQENSKITFDLVANILGVVDEAIIESFIQQYKSSSKIDSELLEQIEKIKSPKLFFERLLEKVIAELDSQLLVNKLIKILFNLDKLDNNSLIIKTFLYDITMGGQKSDTKIIKEKLETIQTIKTEQNTEIKKERIAKVEESIEITRKNTNEINLGEIIFSDERANAIISTSEKYIQSDKMIIVTKFKFNVNHLIKPEIKSIIIEQLKQKGIGINDLTVITEAEKGSLKIDSNHKTNNSDSKPKDMKVEVVKDLKQVNENTQSITDKVRAQSNTTEDNSAIIEGLLI